MQLPPQLSRRKRNVHKNNFGHILILAGSRNMAGAACLSGLAAMRSGSGLVTLGIPKSLNPIVQRKMSPVLMTLPLKETRDISLSLLSYPEIQKNVAKYSAMAIGPGLSRNEITKRLILKVVEKILIPIVIDADALNALSSSPKVLTKNVGIKVLTPHPGEMGRLIKLSKNDIERNRTKVARTFAKEYKCTLVLKGYQSVVADSNGQTYINKSGNSGMATAGSGDVLTGMIAAFLGQGMSGFEAAKYGVYLHGKAGDLAACEKGKVSMIATDIIDQIPEVLR